MTIERTFHCDGPDCEHHWGQSAQRELDMPILSNAGPTLHFCSWDCVLKHAATKPPPIVVPREGPEPPEVPNG